MKKSSNGKGELEQAYKDNRELYEVTTEFGVLAFRKPRRSDYERFTTQLTDGKIAQTAALHALVRSCVAYPSVDQFEIIIDELPALLVNVGGEIQKMGGSEIEGVVKKGG